MIDTGQTDCDGETAMQRIHWKRAAAAMILGLATLTGCATQSVQNSIIVKAGATASMDVKKVGQGSLHVTNVGIRPIDVILMRTGEVSAMGLTLEPNGSCSVSLTDVRQVLFHNTHGVRSVVQYRASGGGKLAIAAKDGPPPKVFAFEEY
jgi:hypothetical protein